MKLSKVVLVTILISAFITIIIVNIQLAKPKTIAGTTLDMVEVMTRAFDQDEGGEGDCEMVVENSDGLAIITNAKKNLFGTCKKKCDYICTKRGWPDLP